MLELIGHYITQVISTTSYLGIFVFMFLESALIPIPSEITMPFAGFLASQGKLSLIGIIIDGTLANLAGSLLAYYIGVLLEENVLEKIIQKYGNFVLLSPTEYHHAMSWFRRYGDKVTFFSRLLPGIRTIISLPAGLAKMNLKKFIVYTTVGCFIWTTLLAYIGFVLGKNWQSIHGYYSKFEYLIVAGIVALIAYYIYKHTKKRS